MKISSRASSFVIAISLVASAGAAELMREQFEYAFIGGSLSGQSGGSGFGGAWTPTVSPPLSTGTIDTGLTFSDLPVSGNSLLIHARVDFAPFGGGIGFTRDIGDASIPAVGGELWVSYLYRYGSGASGGDDSRVVIANSGGSASRFVLTSRDDALEQNGGVGIDGSDEGGSNNIQNGTTHLLIARFTNFGQLPQTGDFWALRPSDYDAIKSGGLTIAELDANAWSKGSDTTPPTSTASTYDTFNTVAITCTVGGSSPGYIYNIDEIRYGTDLSSVVPVPEPGAAMLLIVSAGVLTACRRRPGPGFPCAV